MVIYPVCGATKALIRLNANHMGQQVELPHSCGPNTYSRTHIHTHIHTQRREGGGGDLGKAQ